MASDFEIEGGIGSARCSGSAEVGRDGGGIDAGKGGEKWSTEFLFAAQTEVCSTWLLVLFDGLLGRELRRLERLTFFLI